MLPLSQAEIMKEREGLRRKSDRFLQELDNLREKIHLAEGVEESLEIVLEGLKSWGYTTPRIYRYTRGEEYRLVKALDLPPSLPKKKISFGVSSHKILEEILQSESVYCLEEVPPSLIGGEEDPLFHILQERPDAKGLVGIPYDGFSKTYENEIKGVIVANFDPAQKKIDYPEREALEKLSWLVGEKVTRLLEHRLLERQKKKLEELNQKLILQNNQVELFH